MKNESTLQKALSTRVSFVKLDAEKDEGKALRDDFPVSGFPTFVLVDAKGEYLAHFSGYGDPQSFLAELDELLRDPLTLPARKARFEATPTFADAKMLARYHEGRGEYERADTYFVSAQGLIADPAVFGALLGGVLLVALSVGLGRRAQLVGLVSVPESPSTWL